MSLGSSEAGSDGVPGPRLMRASFVFLLFLRATTAPATAEDPTGTLHLRVRHAAAPVAQAEVVSGDVSTHADTRGEARLTLPPGPREITASHPGFAPATVQVTIRAGAESTVTIQLAEERRETEVVVVTATRSGTIVQDQPLRVEAVPEEEIEENLTIAPGNLTTLLNELGGLRVQTAGAGLGGARLRLQGLRGRYTMVLLDDLPLHGGQPDDSALLQTPPLDLAQVEVIKGAGTALYGGAALGGLVNLASRRPGSEPEVLVNRTSRGGPDAVAFTTHRLSDAWGWTLLGGGHLPSREDGGASRMR